MCLDRRVSKVKFSMKVSRAWKIFYGIGPKNVRLPYRGLEESTTIPRGKWLRAEEKPLGLYTSGFHCYRTERAAKEAAWYTGSGVVAVEVRGVHTHGRQDGRPCLVARWMRVPLPVKSGAKK